MITKDIIFKVCGNVGVLMDIYMPDSSPKQELSPALVFFHGGGWYCGDKGAMGFTDVFRLSLAERGIATVSVGYRHAGFGGTYPTPLCDAADAVRFLQTRGNEYGIDGNRLVLCGGSAGAHIALLTAFHGECYRDKNSLCAVMATPRAVVSMSGPVSADMKRFPEKDGSTFLYGCIAKLLGDKISDADVIQKVSPITYVENGEAPKIPALIVHGTEDNAVPYTHAEGLYQVGLQKGYPFELLLCVGATHIFKSKDGSPLYPTWPECGRIITEFIANQLQIK